MAWGDTIPFEVIEREYGLTAKEVQKLMRKHQTKKRRTAVGENESKNAWEQVVNTNHSVQKPQLGRNTNPLLNNVSFAILRRYG